MQGLIYNLRKYGCDYKSTAWILFIVVYLVQVEMASAIHPQNPRFILPDSDETVINNATNITTADSNLEIHEIAMNDKTSPKKVENINDDLKKVRGPEKSISSSKISSGINMTSDTSTETSHIPEHIPETDEILSKGLKSGKISKTAEKLLSNSKEETAPIKNGDVNISSSFIPKVLPKTSVNINNVTIPLIENHNNPNSTSIPAVFPKDNSTGPVYNVNQTEAFDMTHSKKYTGQFDIDDVKHIAEKLNTTADPNSQVDVDKNLDKNGPKSMSADKNNGFSGVLTSTSNVLAISSAVLASKPNKAEKTLQPMKAVAATILTLVGMMIFGTAAFLLWRRVMQRRFGHREMLINEDDFEESSDLHHFQGTTLTTPNLVA